MAYTFTRTGAQIEEIHNTVEDPKSNTQFSDDIRTIAGEYRGLWPDTGGSANKGDTYQTQVSGTGTGQYFTALQDTTVDPIGDDVNWRSVVSAGSIGVQEVTAAGSNNPRSLNDRFADTVYVEDYIDPLDAWSEALSSGKSIDFGNKTYNLTSLPTFLSNNGSYSYFGAFDVDGMEVRASNAKFYVDNPLLSGLKATVFGFNGVHDSDVDEITVEVNPANAGVLDIGCAAIRIEYSARKSTNISIGKINGKNVSSGCSVRGSEADYITNGFDSVLMSDNIDIKEINCDNSDLAWAPSLFLGYGFVAAFAGSNSRVEKINCPSNITRALFIYGIRHFNANVYAKDTQATTINVGAFGSAIDIHITASLVQDQNLPTDLTRMVVAESGAPDGTSADITAGRQHQIKDVSIKANCSGSGNVDFVHRIGKNTGDGSDSDILFDNIDFDFDITVSSGRDIDIFASNQSDNTANIETRNVTVNKVISQSGQSWVSLLEGAKTNISIYDADVQTFRVLAKDPANVNSVIFENSVIRDNTGAAVDAKVVFNNTRLNTIENSANVVNPFNKTFKNSWLGSGYIEDKGRYDVYTNVTTTLAAFHNPSDPVMKCAIGGAVAGINETPKLLTLSANTDRTVTPVNFYFDSFFRENYRYISANPFNVKIFVKRNSPAGSAVLTGRLFTVGITTDDITTAGLALEIDTIYDNGVGITAGDISISTPNATTIEIACTVEVSEIYFTAQRF